MFFTDIGKLNLPLMVGLMRKSQFVLLPHLPQKLELVSIVVKIYSKIIIKLPWSKSVKPTVLHILLSVFFYFLYDNTFFSFILAFGGTTVRNHWPNWRNWLSVSLINFVWLQQLGGNFINPLAQGTNLSAHRVEHKS